MIDEEHEPTYKSEQTPRYHARETALRRAQTEGASVVLGSATPSMEAMYRAKNGEYVLMEMKNRSKMQDPAEVYTVDMRKELKNGNRSILSEQLQRLMKERLERKNRRCFFEPERVFRVCFVPGMRACYKVSALRCVAFGPSGRKDEMSLLRIRTDACENMS